MLMVVFGAGASCDSALSHPRPRYPDDPDPVGHVRLPLADELFDERDLFVPILERFAPALVPTESPLFEFVVNPDYSISHAEKTG